MAKPQTFKGPEIEVGIPGLDVTTVNALQTEALFPQALEASTQTEPEACVELKLTAMELVLWPDAIVAPAGTVHA